MVELLRDLEPALMREGFDAREQITGPLVDSLYANDDVLTKRLEDGLSFEFLYRSKIAREIVMAPENSRDHVWEPQTTRLLKMLSCIDADAVVGGAYSGDQAIFIAHQLSKSGKAWCHCFEPNADQRQMLQRNVELNRLGNVRVQSLGLWNNDDDLLRLVGFDSFAHAEVWDSQDVPDSSAFQTTTLNTYALSHGIGRLGLIMLDIEGAEYAALQGASDFLMQPYETAPNIVFEVHRDYVDWSDGLEKTELVTYLQSYGYEIFAVRDFNSSVDMKGCPVELIPVAEVFVEGPRHGFNMLAIKDRKWITGDDFREIKNVSPKLLWHRDPRLHLPVELHAEP